MAVKTTIDVHTHIYVYVYIYICIVCVCDALHVMKGYGSLDILLTFRYADEFDK